MIVRAMLVGMLFILAACTRGPDTDVVKRDALARLERSLPPGTITLAGFARRGSQKDTDAPGGETRRVVYFDAELRLERDFDFGAWDTPGVAGLVSALGAGPRGVDGIRSGGNKAGDVIRVHGTSRYREEDGRWVAVASPGYQPSDPPSYATSAPQNGATAILDAMRRVVESVSREGGPAQMAAVEEELAMARAAIRARLARATTGYAIAAGPEHGQYLRFVQALAGAGGPRIVPLVTPGGERNIRLLREGKVSLALSQADAALDAFHGKAAFEGEAPYASLRALGSLYPEPLHVLVRADSRLASMAGLRGRRIAIGRPESASRTTALRVLEAHGIGAKDFEPFELELSEALAALRDKRVDAVLQVIGVPADSVRDAAGLFGLKLLPLADAALTRLHAPGSAYFGFAIPLGTYPDQDEDVRTVATAALMLVGDGLSDSEVDRLTRFIFEPGRDLAARGSAQGAQLSRATARTGLVVPLHPAAAKALEAAR